MRAKLDGMSKPISLNRQLWIVIGVASFVSVVCLGLAWNAMNSADQDHKRFALLGEDNRTLRDKTDRLGGQIERLKQDFAESSNQLKTKDELLTRAEQLRQEIQQQQQDRQQREKQRQEFVLSAREKVLKQISTDQGSVFLSDHELTIRLSERILFDPGKSEIMTEGETVLNNIANLLNGELKDCEVRIEGHTDNVPIGQNLKQKYPSNWELSAARASSAVVFLTEKGQVTPKRLSAVGRADTSPVVENDTPQNKAKNRRIDIVINLNRIEPAAALLPAPSAPKNDAPPFPAQH